MENIISKNILYATAKSTLKHFIIFRLKTKHKTQPLFFENEKIEHAFYFFVQTKRARKLIILIIQIIRVFRRFQMRDVVNVLLKIAKLFLSQVKLLSKIFSQFSHCFECSDL